MKFSKILIFLVIGCVVGLLLVFGVRLQAQYTSKKDGIATYVNEVNVKAAPRMGQFRNRQQGTNTNRAAQRNTNKESESKDNSDFYGVIVDNNIFRPLGWRPPNKEPEYTFIGTVTDDTETMAKAFVLERRSNQFYIAKVGDKVGDAVVQEIKDKQIILDKNGEQITLKGGNMQFLKSGGSRRSAPPRAESNNNNNQRSTSSARDAAIRKAKESAERNERMRKEMMQKAEEMRRKFESASQEQREKMIYEFRGRRGRRGDR